VVTQLTARETVCTSVGRSVPALEAGDGGCYVGKGQQRVNIYMHIYVCGCTYVCIYIYIYIYIDIHTYIFIYIYIHQVTP